MSKSISELSQLQLARYYAQVKIERSTIQHAKRALQQVGSMLDSLSDSEGVRVALRQAFKELEKLDSSVAEEETDYDVFLLDK